jgi:hypothetical protein
MLHVPSFFDFYLVAVKISGKLLGLHIIRLLLIKFSVAEAPVDSSSHKDPKFFLCTLILNTFNQFPSLSLKAKFHTQSRHR